MRYLVWLVALCATVELGATQKRMLGQVGSIFDMDLFPELRDADDLRGYTKQENDAIEYIKAYNQSRSFLATLVPAKCDLSEWMYPWCCMTLEILDHPHENVIQICVCDLQSTKRYRRAIIMSGGTITEKVQKGIGTSTTFLPDADSKLNKTVCVDMALEWRELTLSLALNHNGEVLFSFEFVLGEICIGLPFMKKIAVCGHVYHIDFKEEPNLFLRACLTVKLNALINLIEVRFYCLDAKRTSATHGILKQSWDLSRSFDNDPPTSAMFAVLIKKDKVAIEFNSPIPQELIDAMKKWMGAAIDKITDAIMVVKKAVVKAWNTVATAATNAWSWCKRWFG